MITGVLSLLCLGESPGLGQMGLGGGTSEEEWG